MKRSRFLFLLKADLLRGRRLIPGLLVYTLLFLGSALFITHFGSRILFHRQQFSDIRIVFYLPEGTEYASLEENILSNLTNLRDGIHIDAVFSREEGLKQVEEGNATVFIAFPDQFLAGLAQGENKPVEILLKENDSLEEHIVTDLILSYSSFLGTAESAAYTAHDLAVSAGLSAEDVNALERRVDRTNMGFVLSRSIFFRAEAFDTLTRHTLEEKIISSFLLMILMLTIFLLSWFVRGTNPSYCLQRRMQGLSGAGIFLSEYAVSALLIYGVFLLAFMALFMAGLGPSLRTLWGIVPVILLTALLSIGLIYLIRKPDIAAMAGLFLTVLILYLAGGIIPMEFLPGFLGDSAKWNPFTYVIRYVTDLLFS